MVLDVLYSAFLAFECHFILYTTAHIAYKAM